MIISLTVIIEKGIVMLLVILKEIFGLYLVKSLFLEDTIMINLLIKITSLLIKF